MMMVLGVPILVLLHLALSGSIPAAGESLAAAPDAVRLTFTEPVDLPLSSINLSGPSGQVELGPLQQEGEGRILYARLPAGLQAGRYMVSWQAVGRDGHPVRGEFGFELTIGTPPARAPAEAAEEAVAPPPTPAFSAESPLYAAVRWLTYLSVLGTIGAVVFIFLLGSRWAGLPERTSTGFVGAATRSTLVFGVLAVLALGVALALRLQAQSHAVFGRGLHRGSLELLTGSAWGAAYLLQAAGGLLVLVGLILALRAFSGGIILAAAGAAVAGLSPAVSSHAASVERGTALAVAADGMHVLAAGVWIGTLVVFVVVGAPHLLRLPAPERQDVFSRLLGAFSRVALGAGAVVVLTGLVGMSMQIGAPSDLWRTPYGRVLLGKLALVGLVFAIGAFNWRRLPRTEGEAGGVALFRRSAAAELLIAVLVLVATSVLVAVPPPAHGADPLATMNSNTGE